MNEIIIRAEIAFWGCLVNGSVWAASGHKWGTFFSVVWAVAGFAIWSLTVAVKRTQ